MERIGINGGCDFESFANLLEECLPMIEEFDWSTYQGCQERLPAGEGTE
jgi:hypothetical protein